MKGMRENLGNGGTTKIKGGHFVKQLPPRYCWQNSGAILTKQSLILRNNSKNQSTKKENQKGFLHIERHK